MKKLTFLLAFALVFGMATSALAVPLITLGTTTGGGEHFLWDIYNLEFGTSYNKSQLEALEINSAIAGGLFSSSSGKIWKASRYAGAALTMKSYDSGGDHPIITPSGIPGGGASGSRTWDLPGFVDIPGYVPGWGTISNSPSYTVANSSLFGIWGDANGADYPKWYSEASLNNGDGYHFIFLSTPDPYKFLVGFEDDWLTGSGAGDGDYNDFVFMTENIKVVPEPTTMLLLGMGILGLFGFRKKA
jgi:hypothetical protein